MANAYEEFYDAMIKKHKEDAAKMKTIKDIGQNILWMKGAICEKIDQQFPNEEKIWSDKTDKGFAFSEGYVNYIIAYAYALGQNDKEKQLEIGIKDMKDSLRKISEIVSNFED